MKASVHAFFAGPGEEVWARVWLFSLFSRGKISIEEKLHDICMLAALINEVQRFH